MKKQISIFSILLLFVFLIFGCSAAEKGTNPAGKASEPAADTWATEKGIRQLAEASGPHIRCRNGEKHHREQQILQRLPCHLCFFS